MKKFINIFIIVLMLTILILPNLSYAKHSPEGLIPCGQSVDVKDVNGNITRSEVVHPCTFTDLVFLINNLIDFTVVYLALPIAAIMFAYAGFVLITAPGDESRTKAKRIFGNAILGLILAAGAWLIVKTLLTIAGYNDIPLFFG